MPDHLTLEQRHINMAAIRANSMGWHCITVWECQLKPAVRQATLESLVLTLSKILLDNSKSKRYVLDEPAVATMAADEEEMKYQYMHSV